MASLSRQFAQWVVGLRYEDLPPEVVDRAKGVTLHGLASALLGAQSPDGQEARRIHDIVPGIPIPAAQFEDIIATCRDLDRRDRADTLIRLTLKKA